MTVKEVEPVNEPIVSSEKPESIAQDVKQTEAKPEDPNWKAFREARKKDRLEREAAERKAAEKEAEIAALKAAMEAAFSKTPPNPSYNAPYSHDEREESEDERIEKKVQEAIRKREAEAERQRREQEQREYPQRLEQIYSDFNNVISSENLDYLEYHYPEIANPLKRIPDGFDKWSDIYKAIKKFVPNHTSAKKDAAKAESNFAKPKSMSSASVTQPGEVQSNSRLTEERRAANWERMQKLLKSVG
jgi:hypothetical protein